MSDVAMIAAMGRGRVIGRDNAMPWHLRADLARFKSLTLGHRIVMGHKTHVAIGRPLAGRENVVVSRDRTLTLPGCTVVGDLNAALDAGGAPVFVIGGGQIYAQMLPRATRLFITQVDCQIDDGDTFFPEVDWSAWSLVGYEMHLRDADNDHAMTFMDFCRDINASR